MLTLKARKFGNSVGVILPKEALDKLKMGEGDQVYLTETADGYRLTPYEPDFEHQMTAAQDIMKRYRNTLRELAK